MLYFSFSLLLIGGEQRRSLSITVLRLFGKNILFSEKVPDPSGAYDLRTMAGYRNNSRTMCSAKCSLTRVLV